MCGLISGLLIDSIGPPRTMPILGCFQYCSSLVELKLVIVMLQEVPLLYRVVLTILGFVLFRMKLSIVLLRSVRRNWKFSTLVS